MTSHVEGAEEVQAGLEQASRIVERLLRQGMREAGREVLEWWRVYPPQPNRERSGTFNTWIRGVGEVNESYFTQGAPREIYRASEDLRNRWVEPIPVERRGTHFLGFIQNTASYADEVHGPKQADHHALTGWRTSEQAVQEKRHEVERIIKRVMQKVVDLAERMMQ